MSETKLGKGKYGTRQTVMVRKLDDAKLKEFLTQYAQAVYGNDADGYTPDSLVAVPLKDQTIRGKQAYGLVCTEGVGWIADSEWALFTVFANQDFGGVTKYTFSTARLEELFTEEYVDLADWVNTYNDRLENNFQLWFGVATDSKSAQLFVEARTK